MNRISNYLEKEPEEQYGDFYVVVGEFGYAYVTSETARHVEAVLDRRWVPKWAPILRGRSASMGGRLSGMRPRPSLCSAQILLSSDWPSRARQ
jgi:hypothetical protein